MRANQDIPAQEVTLLAGSRGKLCGEGDFEAMLTAALDGVIELSGAERGLVFLFDEAGRVLVEKGRARGRCDLEVPVRGDVLERVRRRGLPFWEDRRHDERRPETAPMTQRASRHLLVASVPIHHGGRLCGLAYLDHSGAVLPTATLALAQSLAQLVSVAAVRGAGHSWRWRSVDATRWDDPQGDGTLKWDVN